MTGHNDALLERILEVARIDDGIRALALIGSGVDAGGRNDEYSDIDLILVTGDSGKYVDSASWVAPIGEVWFSFSEAVNEANHRERRFLFKGGLDVDVVVIDSRLLASSPESLVIAREICSGGCASSWTRTLFRRRSWAWPARVPLSASPTSSPFSTW